MENNQTTNGKELNLTADTKLVNLFKEYPNLKEDLIKLHPKFEMLNSPMAKMMLPIATLGMISKHGGVSLDVLIKTLTDVISKY